ncbi:MASE1 domain-containing protein [Bradyrhizobium diazoefficiens]|uniref:MASE1 domain-containing protein n=1 Tax=Bradyrhizobium diazoefficiens TaxID=1355477 RepID=UPI003470AA5A
MSINRLVNGKVAIFDLYQGDQKVSHDGQSNCLVQASTMSDPRSLTPEMNFRQGTRYAGVLVAIGVIYFVLAKGGLALASVHPSATPIWPPTGLALAAVLLWGYRTWPAIFNRSGDRQCDHRRLCCHRNCDCFRQHS